MLRRLCLLPFCLFFLVAAAPPTPAPRGGDYDVRIRYRIFAFRTERIRQYRQLRADLAAAGFERDPDEAVGDDEADDPNASMMRGAVPASGVKRLLTQRHIRSLLLTPKGVKWPDKGKRVRVEITLEGGFLPETQRDLARQSAAVLTKGAGFVESVGYDHKGHARLVGSVPVENLERIHGEPGKLPGADDQPLFRKLAALRVILVRPDLPVPSARPAAPAIAPEQLKFDPALRSLLADADKAKGGVRLEVILGHTPTFRQRGWIETVESTGAAVEGRTGPLVTVVGALKDIVPKLAALEDVVAVRVPRAARQAQAGPRGEVPEKWEPLRASGLTKLHAIGLRGKGTRVAILSDDFKGWRTLTGRKDGKAALPDPVLVDLTAARNSDLLPDPYPSESRDVALGHGTRCAMSFLKAAPEAELTLVRVDAAAAYMVEEAARAINGERVDRSLSLDTRYQELQATRRVLETRAEELLEERRAVFADTREDDEPKKRRQEYQEKQKKHAAAEAVFRTRESRYLRHLEDVKKLKGIRMVASGLVWTDGYPVDGSSALSRYFDDAPFKAALWFQAAGDTRGQSWAGLFRDGDGNGVMEFAEAKSPLPKGAWTREINFLSWRPGRADEVRELPAGTHVRLTLQWREPHDSLPLKVGEDVYREPLAKLKLLLVHQPDPDGKARPADDLEVIAQSSSPPQRLNQTLNSATWEYVIELRLTKAGRYGVLIEGKVPESIQAEGEVRLPATKRFGELRPRLFVNTLAGAGRAVWSDFPSQTAALGMPADARRVVTVGAADAKDRARPSSASGSPFNLALVSKPDVLAYDDGGGTSEAACFAAGLAASSWGSRGSLLGVIERLSRKPGDVLRVPDRK